ncbi:MAG: hypothetical protein JXA66_07585 [Oligoflexia bacterium]|nr:hypothetical protein [Oligoflexia bacterium]
MKKNRHQKLLGVFTLVFFVTSFSCGKLEDETVNNAAAAIRSVLISDADNLFVASKNLYKINAQNNVEKALYLDAEGNQVDTSDTIAVYDVNDDYVIIVFGFSEGQYGYSGILVNKNTEAAYLLGEENVATGLLPYSEGNSFRNSKVVLADYNDHIFFSTIKCEGACNNVIRRLDVSNPEAITSQQYTSDNEWIDAFTTDPSGNLLYSGYRYENANLLSAIYRVKKANSAIENLQNTSGSISLWKAADSKLYYLSSNDIYSIDIDSGFDYSESLYGTLSSGFSNSGSYVFNFSDKTVVVASDGLKSFEVYNSTDTPSVTSLSGVFNSITAVVATDDHYYIAGTNSSSKPFLAECNLSHNCTALADIPANTYDIYNMSINSDDEIIFNALKMADGLKIVAKVKPGEGVTILDEQLNVEVTTLVRIR